MWNVSAFLTQTFAFVLGRAFSIINNASGSLVCSLRGDWGTLFHLQVINQGEKAVSKKELGITTCLHWLRVSVPTAFFGTRVSSQAQRSQLMTNMCVRYLAKRTCVWFSWLWNLYFNLQKAGKFSLAKETAKFSIKCSLTMTGKGAVRRQLRAVAPPLARCLSLWLLKVNLYRAPFVWGSVPLLQSSIWSLQPPGHNDTLCLLYIRTSAATLSTGKTHLCSLHGSPLATFPSMNAHRMPICLCLLCINLASWSFQKSFCHFKSK